MKSAARAALVAALFIVVGVSALASDVGPPYMVQRANALAAQGQYDEAFRILDLLISQAPGNTATVHGAVQVGRLMNQSGRIGDRLEAEKPKLADYERFNLLQAQAEAYLHANRADDVERIRNEIRWLWRDTGDQRIKQQKYFVRDGASIDGRAIVIAAESFEMTGPRAVRYIFELVPARSPRSFVSLGSYDFTTETTREMLKKPNDWRAWHLDAYSGNQHQTLMMWNDGEPSFEVARDLAVDFFRRASTP